MRDIGNSHNALAIELKRLRVNPNVFVVYFVISLRQSDKACRITCNWRSKRGQFLHIHK